jgi:hypothetical protein
MAEVMQTVYEYADHGDAPCRFRLRIFRDPDRPIVAVASDHERELWPGCWCRHDPEVRCMWAIFSHVVDLHELDPDCVVWVETDRGGRLERVDYGGPLRRWCISSAAVTHLLGEAWC